MSIGETLRNLRLKTKNTLREQSEIFGVSVNTIYRWEHNLAVPRKSVLKEIASYYKIPLEALIQGTLTETPPEQIVVAVPSGGDTEQQLLYMFRKLSDCNRYRILGYMERICVEGMDTPQVEATVIRN